MNKLGLVIILLFASNGCVDLASDDIEYTMFNKTDMPVKIMGFVRPVDTDYGRAAPISIDSNSEFKVVRITGLDDNTGQRFYSSFGVDSVRIVFDNKRVKIYTRESVFNTAEASILDGDDNNQHFITQSDYDTAEDCNGDCE